MLAYNVFTQGFPKISRGEFMTFEHDDGTMEDIAYEDIQYAFDDNYEALQFFDDLNRGIIRLTLEEYKQLPYKVLVMYRIFNNLAKRNN